MQHNVLISSRGKVFCLNELAIKVKAIKRVIAIKEAESMKELNLNNLRKLDECF